jgi:hypothetical protein
MSRTSVLTRVKRLPVCEICGEEISHDVVRVDEGRIYHLRCFRRHLHEGEIGMQECPTCRTLGCGWDWRGHAWKPCARCGGGGYLSTAEEACGN